MLAKGLWKDLTGDIIENEEVKENAAEKEAKMGKLNKRAMAKRAQTTVLPGTGEEPDDEKSLSDDEI